MINRLKEFVAALGLSETPAWLQKFDHIEYPVRYSIQSGDIRSPGPDNTLSLLTLDALDSAGMDITPVVKQWNQETAEWIMLGSVVGVNAPQDLSEAHLRGLRLLYERKKPTNFMDDYFIKMVLQRKHHLLLHAFDDFNDAVNTMEGNGKAFLDRYLPDFIKENSYVRESTWHYAEYALRFILKSIDRAYNEANATAHPELVDELTIKDVGVVAKHIFCLRGDIPDDLEHGSNEYLLFLSTYHPSHCMSIVMYINTEIIYGLKKRAEKTQKRARRAARQAADEQA